MAHDDPRYLGIGEMLGVTPPISRIEAERAARALYRHFGHRKYGGPSMTANAKFKGKARRCWIAQLPGGGLAKGWGRLVHDVAHDIFGKRHPKFRPHDGGHSTLEREIAHYVVVNGWMTREHSLKPIAKPRPTGDELRAKKLAQVDAGIKRWTTKLNRASNALRKLERKRRALTRVTV